MRSQSPRAGWLREAAISAVFVSAVACSGDDASGSRPGDGDAAVVTTTSVGEQHGGSHGSGSAAAAGGAGLTDWCPSRLPGELLTSEEAIVQFDTERICPGYVTVTQGTEVTWHNRDVRAHTLSITFAARFPATTEPGVATDISEVELQPGERWVRKFDDGGFYAYRVSAIQFFSGTVEVR